MRSTTLTVSQAQWPIKKHVVSSFWPCLISGISFPFEPPRDCSRPLLPSWSHPDRGCRSVDSASCLLSPPADESVPSNSPSSHPPPSQATHGQKVKLSNSPWARYSPVMCRRSPSALAKLGPSECQPQWVFYGRDLIMLGEALFELCHLDNHLLFPHSFPPVHLTPKLLLQRTHITVSPIQCLQKGNGRQEAVGCTW